MFGNVPTVLLLQKNPLGIIGMLLRTYGSLSEIFLLISYSLIPV